MKMKTTLLILAMTTSGFAFSQTQNACTSTVNNSLLACQAQADSKNLLAVAACQNVDPAQVQTCTDTANTAKDEAVTACGEQNVAQLEVCNRLGGAAYNPQIDPASFSATVTNKYFPVTTGTRSVFEGPSSDGAVKIEIAPTGETKTIQGVNTAEVKSVTTVADKVVDNSWDYFSQDTEGNVWYFGHTSQKLENDQVTEVDSWMAGVDGAQAGTIMKAEPKVADLYRKAYAIQVDEGLGEVQAIDESVTVPAGAYTQVVKTKNTDAIDPGSEETIFYAPDVGPVQVVDVKSGTTLNLTERGPVVETPTPTPAPVPVP